MLGDEHRGAGGAGRSYVTGLWAAEKLNTEVLIGVRRRFQDW